MSFGFPDIVPIRMVGYWLRPLLTRLYKLTVENDFIFSQTAPPKPIFSLYVFPESFSDKVQHIFFP